jgi:AraC-like DNA-binding protein
VALACGFADPGRFARAFRARYGATPRRWRL